MPQCTRQATTDASTISQCDNTTAQFRKQSPHVRTSKMAHEMPLAPTHRNRRGATDDHICFFIPLRFYDVSILSHALMHRLILPVYLAFSGEAARRKWRYTPLPSAPFGQPSCNQYNLPLSTERNTSTGHRSDYVRVERTHSCQIHDNHGPWGILSSTPLLRRYHCMRHLPHLGCRAPASCVSHGHSPARCATTLRNAQTKPFSSAITQMCDSKRSACHYQFHTRWKVHPGPFPR